MNLRPTPVDGAYVIETEWVVDERGRSGRVLDTVELEGAGLVGTFVQANVSRSTRAGTLRGLHFQVPPGAQAKLIRCARGRIFDVVADVRTGSRTLGAWAGIELDGESSASVYAPPGTAHGFLTLTDDVDVVYAASARYTAELERGVRWDDRFFSISWPGSGPTILSAKDRGWPRFEVPAGR